MADTTHPRLIDPQNDPFAWLEDVEGEASLAWVRQRNAAAESALQDQEYTTLQDELRQIMDASDRIPAVVKRGPHLYNFWTDAQHPQGLWRRTSLDSYLSADPQWEILLDLDALCAAESTTWVWHGATVLRPEHAGPETPWRHALISLSRGGSDADVTREFDLLTKEFIPEDQGGFYKPEGKGGLSWIDQDTVYAAVDLSGSDELGSPTTTAGYPRVARRWRRGTELTQAEPIISVGEDDMVAAVGYDSTPGYERHLASRVIGFYDSETYVVTYDDADEPTLTRIEVETDVQIGFHRDLIFFAPRTDTVIANTATPGGSLWVTDAESFLHGLNGGEEIELTPLFTPTDSTSLQGICATRNVFVLTVMEDVVEHVEAHWRNDDGWQSARVFGDIAGAVSVSAVDARETDEVWITAEDFLTPTTKYLGSLAPMLHGAAESVEQLKQAPERFEASGLATAQRFAVSADGTRVPYFLIGPAETVQAAVETQQEIPGETSIVGFESKPTVLYGYGGFEISQTPAYLSLVGKAWLEKGGVFALANIRGGGEYGPRWHRAALKQHRNRAYEDFAAVARDLVETGVTTVQKLACRGGSNGGLLTGNMLTQYPELFGAVVIQVPLLDMKRYSHLLAGASWRAEYGDPDTDDWEFISRFSPYHLLRSDTAYPPVLLTTSTRDDRVHPGHARKMTAALESLGADVTYWENTEGGHGGAANPEQRATMNALIHRYLWTRLNG